MKKILGVLLALTLVFSLTACGGNSRESIIKKTTENMSKVESLSGDLTLDVEMIMQEKGLTEESRTDENSLSVNLGMNIALEATQTFNYLNGKIDFDMFGEKVSNNIEAYSKIDGEEITTYQNLEGTWSKSSSTDMNFDAKNYTNINFDKFTLNEKTEKFNDKDVYVFEGEMLPSELSSMESLDLVNSFGLGGEFDGLKSTITCKVYIYKDSKTIAKTTIDMKNIMEEMLSYENTEEFENIVNKFEIQFTINEINKVKDRPVPTV